MNLAIVTPAYSGVSVFTIKSVLSLKCIDATTDWYLENGTYIAQNRNRAIRKIFERTALPSHVLFLDSDIVFTEGDLLSLEKLDKPVATAAYAIRGRPDALCAGKFVDGWKLACLPASSQSIIDVEWCGAGFMLARLEVLQHMEAPWFRHEITNNIEEDGEDIGFCRCARRLGYTITCDCAIKVGHV